MARDVVRRSFLITAVITCAMVLIKLEYMQGRRRTYRRKYLQSRKIYAAQDLLIVSRIPNPAIKD